MLVFKYARIFGVVMLSALFASHVAGQCHTHWPSGNAGCASQNELGDGGMGVHRERWEQFKAAYNLDVARNVAWPQPFKCRDRALMYQFFQTGIDAGWEQICTLTSVHFDSETNQLNRAGEAKVQWLMQTSPQHRRAIFVYNDDTSLIDHRIASVKDTVDRWYGHLGGASVVMTTTLPHTPSGAYHMQVTESFMQALPTPALNASIGGTIQDQ